MTLKEGLRSNGLDTQSNAGKLTARNQGFLAFCATHCYATLRFAYFLHTTAFARWQEIFDFLLLHGNLWQQDGVLRTPFDLKISLL